MAAPLINSCSENRNYPFQVKQLPGKDFQCLSSKNYNYLERWVFPPNLCALLTQEGEPFSITRIIRYTNPDRYSVETLQEIDPIHSLHDKDIVYTARIAKASAHFFQILASNAYKHCSTHINLEPLHITLRVGAEEAILSLEQI